MARSQGFIFMSFAAFLFRAALAFVAGWCAYMLVALVDVLAPAGGFDGFIGLFFQAIMGAVFTSIALLALALAGSPLYLLRGWRAGVVLSVMCAALIVGGVSFIALARLPGFTIEIPNPEFGPNGPPLTQGNPSFEIGGWLAMMFGILHIGGPAFIRAPKARLPEPPFDVPPPLDGRVNSRTVDGL